MIQKALASAALLVLTGGTGLWLGKMGKPYGTLPFTVHKLIALGFVVLTGMTVFGMLKTVNSKTLLLVGSGLLLVSVIALFVSGALMSVGKAPFNIVNSVHKIAALMVLIGIGIITYLKIK